MRLKRKRLLVVPVVLFAVFYLGNVISGHRLAYGMHEPIFCWITTITNSPSGRYSVAIQSDGMQGVTHYVKVARWCSFWPRTIMQSDAEDVVPIGPEKARLAMVWAVDDRAVALIHLGWFVDYYDFSTKHDDSFGAGIFPYTDTNALMRYHARIAEKFGSNSRKQIAQ